MISVMENSKKTLRHRKRRLCEYCNEEYSHSAYYAHKRECKELKNFTHDHSHSDSDFEIDSELNSSLNSEYESEIVTLQVDDNGPDLSSDTNAGPDLSSDTCTSDHESCNEELPLEFDSESSTTGNDENDDETRYNDLVEMTMIFLLKWQFMFHISNNAMDMLIKFLHKLLNHLSTVKQNEDSVITNLAKEFPLSITRIKKIVGLDKKMFLENVVCYKCHSIYENISQCMERESDRARTKYCKHKPFPAHPNKTLRKECAEPLLKHVRKMNQQLVLQPFKTYCYNPLVSSITLLFKRQNFVELCQQWRKRVETIPQDWLGDIYDGRIWKEQIAKGYFDSPYNLAVSLNVDWFQPYSRVTDSLGVIYLCILNLPRHLRYKQENIILVGIIPGPKEPKLNINSYLSPLVDELKEFWYGMDINLDCDIRINACIRLLCVSCDIPATRKVCGFVSHRSNLGCSKCLCEFKHNSTGGMEVSGTLGEWSLRTLEQHRAQSDDYLRCKTKADQKKITSQYGIRFSVLLNIPEFNPIRNHVIDPMHNLLLGTSKHMLEVWIKLNLLNAKSFSIIEQTTSLISCPHDIGRMPLKIGSAFSGFTADQWKIWTTVYSPVALKGVLPDNHIRVWLLFVRACSILCHRITTKDEVESANLYITQFYKKFLEVYGNEHLTPNMHMHLHLKDCCLDYGSIYGFWCFAYERYNGILGTYQTNKKCVESQLMKQFLSQQIINSLKIKPDFKQFDELLNSNTQEKGSLKMDITSTTRLLKFHLMAQSTLESLQLNKNHIFFAAEDGARLLPTIHEKILQNNISDELKNMYIMLYPSYEIEHFSLFSLQSNSALLLSQVFNSKNSRNLRNSVYIASWPANLDTINCFTRVCQINYFLKHTTSMKHKETGKMFKSSHILCYVSWFKSHLKQEWFGTSAIVCKAETENESSLNFIPLQRLIAPCAFGFISLKFDSSDEETVLVAIPLSSQLYV